jgi:tetratricopeptide (TPR) repeat protein
VSRWMGLRPGMRVTLMVLGVLAACAAPRAAGAQVGEGAQTADSVGVDYFTRNSDSKAAFTIHTIETHHLAENNFWKRYRDGDFRWAFEDLIFILRYCPNHPKALYLIAFDKKLNKDTGAIINRFERALRLYPRSAYTYAQYGLYLASLGQENAGIVYLDEALKLDPKLVAARAWREEAERGRSAPDSTGTSD